MNPVEVVILSAAFTMVGSTLAWFLARKDKREDRAAASATPGAPTVQEIWQRQDRIENALRSALVILGEVAEQVDDPHELVLSKRHLKVLSDGGYLPPEFDNLVSE
ncbi:hypothetical protein SEA_SUCHA_26 [Microbacterium phage Sucha]|nr:hypothetical protein SEA_SUCHA_26 [Microbacterium phage Sucha]